MITDKELQATRLSPTNKDYYQIWNELLDTAAKLSERWDPKSTNEGDPGIVLLKVLTAIADKLSYNIDKNILEAFMPSAAQAESMRALCEMMGYNMKYYRSATTNIVFSYAKPDSESLELPDGGLNIPMFTVIQNNDKDVFYITTAQRQLSKNSPVVEIPVMEGQLVKCETDNDNLITMNQIDDFYRYYLPEVQIAENGIFIFDVEDGITTQDTTWEKVDNLNTQENGKRCWKFGFDSNEGKPYIQFPEDVAQLIKDGLEIYFLRTSGVNGNVAARVLTSYETPSLAEWEDFADSVNFTVINPNAAITGANPESLTAAYNGFKKTVGTFDTLVTCRDYMNKIYQLVDENDKPVVSNIIVTDIRDDINRAKTICQFNDYGICYKEISNKTTGNTPENRINSFDIVLYPFKTYNNLGTKLDYEDSFKYAPDNYNYIQALLKNIKTLSHVYKLPEDNDIVCIKNYLKLDAIITTTVRVNAAEQVAILANIRTALYNSFNMRELDFGEAIPFDSILNCIETADPRIKDVSMYEPDLLTVFVTEDGAEHNFASTAGNISSTFDASSSRLYNKLALANILAGKISLFNYDTTFKSDFNEGGNTRIYPQNTGTCITSIETECRLPIDENNQIEKLTANEVIKLRTPNYVTEVTYPAYVNYFFKKANSGTNNSNTNTEIERAEFITVAKKMKEKDNDGKMLWDKLDISSDEVVGKTDINTADAYTALFNDYDVVYKLVSGVYIACSSDLYDDTLTTYYCGKIKGNMSLFRKVGELLLTTYQTEHKDNDYELSCVRYSGYFDSIGMSFNYPENGRFVENYVKYRNISNYNATLDAKSSLFYCVHPGRDIELSYIPKDTVYRLDPNNKDEYLCINYTEASKSDDGIATGGEGTIQNRKYPATNEVVFIRPNFDLKDSMDVYRTSTKSWRKIDGYAFEGLETGAVPGMYSLDTSEQIEIVKQASSKITGACYLYWILANGETDLLKGHGDCDVVNNDSTKTATLTYTLQEGEYFFYTDENKLDMAYFGAGTVLEIHVDGDATGYSTLVHGAIKGLKQPENHPTASVDDILANGLNSVPWINFNFSSKAAVDSAADTLYYAEFKEYKYITLTEGTEVQQLRLSDPDDSRKLDNNWKIVEPNSEIEYSINGNKTTIKVVATRDSKKISDWEARSALELNVGPTLTQTLTGKDFVKINTSNYQINNTTGEWELGTVKDSTTIYNTSMKTSELYQSTLDKISTESIIIGKGDKLVSAYPAKLKNFELQAITLDGGEARLNNMENIWTKVALADLDPNADVDKGFKINVNIPEANPNTPANFGIMMVYYTRKSTEAAKQAYIKVSNTATDAAPVIYNYCGSVYGSSMGYVESINDFRWWAGLTGSETDPNRYTLREGLNIVVFKKSTEVRFMVDTKADGTDYIIFSGLDILSRADFGIDITALDYQDDGEEKPQQLVTPAQKAASTLLKNLHDILGDNNQFYYNMVLDTRSTIDLNYETLEGNGGKKLSSPYMWYDYNNIANKFVISEIDANHLLSGIKIANASKARY